MSDKKQDKKNVVPTPKEGTTNPNPTLAVVEPVLEAPEEEAILHHELHQPMNPMEVFGNLQKQVAEALTFKRETSRSYDEDDEETLAELEKEEKQRFANITKALVSGVYLGMNSHNQNHDNVAKVACKLANTHWQEFEKTCYNQQA